MAVDVILDADDGWEPDELPTVTIRIDGELFTAHCPKDGLPLLLARIQSRANDDPSAMEELLTKALQAILAPEDAAQLVERVLDMSDRKITLAYILHVISKVRDHYAPELEQLYAEMGIQENPDRRTPTDRLPARRTSKKTPAKKAARPR